MGERQRRPDRVERLVERVRQDEARDRRAANERDAAREEQPRDRP